MNNVGKIIVMANYKDINIRYNDTHLKSLFSDFISVIDDICNSFNVKYHYYGNMYPLCFIIVKHVNHLSIEIQNKIQKLTSIRENIYYYINLLVTKFSQYIRHLYFTINVESKQINLLLDIGIHVILKKNYYSPHCIPMVLELVKRRYNINDDSINAIDLIYISD